MSPGAAPVKRRVAVLGGGLGGLTAAYEIACRAPECEVTVYQTGWRLGGKVASSRNRDAGMRIEEHGIHVLFGAYENLFHILRRVYDDLQLPWQAAFEERHDFTLMERAQDRWVAWSAGLPRAAGDPGDCLATGGDQTKQAPALTADLISWLRDRVFEYFAGTPIERPARWFFGGSVEQTHRSAASLRDQAASGADARAARRRLLWRLRWNLLLLRIVGWIGHILWFLLRPFLKDAVERSDNIRRLWIAAELSVACAAGLTAAAMDGTTRIQLDAFDLRQWLQREGIFGGRISRTTAESAPLRMVYEVVFGYANGDPAQPALAAGTGIRDLLRLLFDRRGALAYAMRAGSAETLVTPLYRALQQRGVRFEFFHRVDHLELDADGRRVQRIHFTRQATPTSAAYDPLVDGSCWPHRPKYELLVDGEILAAAERADGERNLEMPTFTPPTATTRVLEYGAPGPDGFDAVVLAIPVEPQKQICAALAKHDPRWREMFEHTKTMSTQSVQLWFDVTARDLGWPASGSQALLLGGYAQPFGNWVDFSITLEHEGWAGWGPGRGKRPGSVAYLCGPVPDADTGLPGLTAQRRYAQQRCTAWLATHGRRLWPKAFDDAGFDCNRLFAAAHLRGEARYDAQFFRTNVNPSDRYTLTLPGTTCFRLAPGASGFADLYLAGDWTANGFDVGSVEATAMSGRLAARALLQKTAVEMPVYGEGA